MARARSPDSIKAEKIYKEAIEAGNKPVLAEIAKTLGVPEGTVRRWKSTQQWDGKSKKKQSERSDKNKTSVRNKGGAPKGNKNAVGNKGGAAKPGNTLALKHGGYSAVYWDTLDDQEKELIEDMPTDDEELLIQQIQLFSVRERRLMQAIKKYRDVKGDLYVSGVSTFEDKRKFKDKEERALYEERIQKKVEKGERLPGSPLSTQTHTGSTIDLITRLEKELTSVQSKKTKAIDALAKLHLEKQKLSGETKGNELVKTWAESVLKARREHTDE